MVKDTSKIVEELGLSPDFKTFYSENKDYMVKDKLDVIPVIHSPCCYNQNT